MDSVEQLLLPARLGDAIERERVLDEVARGLFRTPRPPPQLGRYRVLERIGGGGQGVVYAGWDPQLDRRVAIKILRVADDTRETGHRLRQEAIALAQLAHPNVIAINDVGTFAGGVYLVMQLVPGRTLASWLRERRSWREVLAVFDGAGLGLAAAHRRNIVHRDFKPANVWIGDDGRVRLLDFGLARAGVCEREPSQHESDAAMLGSITATGQILGTPGYMAPEQHDGEPVGGASDQYAYCVALFEALWHASPFDASTLEQLIAAKHAMAIVTPADTRGVPSRVRRIIVRGLHVDPRARWPAMDALLLALAGGGRTMRRRSVRLGAVVLGGALASSVWLADGPPRGCDAHAAIDAIASPTRMDQLTATIVDSGLPFAHDVAARVSARALAYATDWRELHAQTCASLERDPAADARMRCLDRLADELDDTLRMLGERDVVEHADALVRGLDDPSTCSGAARRDDPEQDALRRSLAHARALARAGRAQPASELARDGLADAERLGDDALRAEAGELYGGLLLELGRLDAAIEMLESAYLRATAAGRDDLAFAAALPLVDLFASSRQDPQRCAEWVMHAAAALAHGGDDDPVAHGRLELARAKHGFTAGEYTTAVVHAAAAADLLEGADDLRTTAALDTYARLLANLGRDDEALATARRSARVSERMRGPDHPRTAAAVQTLAVMTGGNGDTAGALTHLARVREIYTAAYGPDDLHVAEAMRNTATMHARAGDQLAAATGYREVLAIQRRQLGADDPKLAQTLYNLSLPLRSLGERDEATRLGEEAVRMAEVSIGGQHPTTAIYLHGLGETLLATDPAGARALFERGRAIMAAALGEQHGMYATFTTSIEHADAAIAARGATP